MGATNIGPQLPNLQNNYQGYAAEKLTLDSEESEESTVLNVPYQTKTLGEIYPDQMDAFSLKIEGKDINLSLLERLRNFWNFFEKPEVTGVEKKEVSTIDAISFAPILEKPAKLKEDIKLQKITEQPSQLSDEQIFEGISKLSEESLQQIMMSVLAIQNEVCRENMLVTMEDFEKFHQAQILHQKAMKEIKETLAKDEQVKSFFKTTQNIAIAAGTIASIAVAVGLTFPFSAAAIATAAVAGAVSAGAKSYYGVRADEDNAKFIGATHTSQVRQKLMDETNERIDSLTKMDTEKQIGEFLGSMIKMLKIIYS